MRTKTLFLVVIFLIAWACKSPLDPEIEEVLKEAKLIPSARAWILV